MNLPIIPAFIDISPSNSTAVSFTDLFTFELFWAWTCNHSTHWTVIVVWRHSILKQKLIWELPLTWCRTLRLQKYRVGVAALLQHIYFRKQPWMCHRLTRMRRLFYLEGAGLLSKVFGINRVSRRRSSLRGCFQGASNGGLGHFFKFVHFLVLLEDSHLSSIETYSKMITVKFDYVDRADGRHCLFCWRIS